MNTPDRRTWFARNWLWAMPAGCLLPVAVGVASVLLIIYMTVSSLKSSEAYDLAMTELTTHPHVVRSLGSPLKSSWDLHGNVHVKNGAGRAKLEIPLTGPEGTGLAVARAIKSDSEAEWKLSFLSFQKGADHDPVILVDLEPKEGDQKQEGDQETESDEKKNKDTKKEESPEKDAPDSKDEEGKTASFWPF